MRGSIKPYTQYEKNDEPDNLQSFHALMTASQKACLYGGWRLPLLSLMPSTYFMDDWRTTIASGIVCERKKLALPGNHENPYRPYNANTFKQCHAVITPSHQRSNHSSKHQSPNLDTLPPHRTLRRPRIFKSRMRYATPLPHRLVAIKALQQ